MHQNLFFYIIKDGQIKYFHLRNHIFIDKFQGEKAYVKDVQKYILRNSHHSHSWLTVCVENGSFFFSLSEKTVFFFKHCISKLLHSDTINLHNIDYLITTQFLNKWLLLINVFFLTCNADFLLKQNPIVKENIE